MQDGTLWKYQQRGTQEIVKAPTKALLVNLDSSIGKLSSYDIIELDDEQEMKLRAHASKRRLLMLNVRGMLTSAVQMISDITDEMKSVQRQSSVQRIRLTMHNMHSSFSETSENQRGFLYELIGDGNVGPTRVTVSGHDDHYRDAEQEKWNSYVYYKDTKDPDARVKALQHRREPLDRGRQKPRKGAYERHNWLRK